MPAMQYFLCYTITLDLINILECFESKKLASAAFLPSIWFADLCLPVATDYEIICNFAISNVLFL